MAIRPRVPTRTLRPEPDLAQLKRQARELLEAFLRGDAAAVAEVHSHVQGARAESFALHDAQLVLARRGDLDAEDRISLVTMLLDAGARLDIRDVVLKSTPLGWACRWGRSELITLFLARGADPIEKDAESWARPHAWARARGHDAILEQLGPE